ncbi:MAG: TonB family protein [Acidobacteriota bacterium]|nr:TonB family protein [Acidobacteriota bacterium]
MKSIFLSQIRHKRLYFVAFFLLILPMLSLSIVWQTGQTQKAPLSFADIIYVLRSKKESLNYRNGLLITAVKERGIDFTLIEEFEKELRKNGAIPQLIEVIRQKSPKLQLISTPKPILTTTPTPNPTPPDSAFYRKRGDDYTGKGEYDRAILDYNEAIRLNPQDAVAYYSRGFAYHYKNDQDRAFENYKTAIQLKNEFALQPMLQCVLYNPTKNDNTDIVIKECSKTINSASDFALAYYIRGNAYRNKEYPDLAIADYNKFIEFNPKNALVYINRGDTYRDIEDYDQAIKDYNKAIELDASNELAKKNLQRLQAELLNISADKRESPASSKKTRPSQIVTVGSLSGYAISLITPLYPQDAMKIGLQGKITVQITIDENGNVISAKADSGSGILRFSAETAASKSKFKPIIVNNQIVKATGFIVYNFILPKGAKTNF